MKRVAVLLVGIAALSIGACAVRQVETPQEEATGIGEREQILRSHDGRYSKHGWNHYGPGHFELDRDTGILTSHGGMGLLWYAVREYGDFVLEVEFKSSDGTTNSGIFFRVPGVPTSDDYIYHSFEVQIDEAADSIHQTSAIYDAEAPSEQASNPPGEWNQYVITVQGDHITVELNGTRVIDWEMEPRGKVEDFAQRGYIGLQSYNSSPVYFRNIYATALN